MSEPTVPRTPDDSGFVRRGLLMLGGMAILVGIVLTILFWKPVPPPTPIPADLPAEASAPGWQVRYNAAIALARRGSAKTPWPIFREMLDENQQLKNFMDPEAGAKKNEPDEAAARSTVLEALKAVAEWHRKQSGPIAVTPEMRSVYSQIDRLAEKPAYKAEADRTRETLPAR
ncbi:MAG TPA: hypothetical protein VHR72_03105 [Gemmataceae bacterium]|jgi:hypothetical protein|nr:hypothetical protein [Gemmataceae bacterium]